MAAAQPDITLKMVAAALDQHDVNSSECFAEKNALGKSSLIYRSTLSFKRSPGGHLSSRKRSSHDFIRSQVIKASTSGGLLSGYFQSPVKNSGISNGMAIQEPSSDLQSS